MFFLLSGEGSTDIGVGLTAAEVCEGDNFVAGPMALIVDMIVRAESQLSVLNGGCGFVSEYCLSRRTDELKAVKKKLRLPGKKRAKETHYFFNNARALSRIAEEKAAELNDDVVAVLFRDADGTASAGRGHWETKRKSMLDGFAEESFHKGVPMIPKPKSEAWLICALRQNPYQGCCALESRSGNDCSPNSLKAELDGILGERVTSRLLCEKVRNAVDFARIDMPSFRGFRERLEEVL